jgi:chemotaxis signal transduction protein
MEGPFDPHSPDAGTTEPVAQDGDLHALLERLLGQGDVRPAEPGAADALWPDLFPVATATPDDVSTIVPAPDALAAGPDAPAYVPPPIEGDAEPARAWEPLVIDSPADHSTNVDDIHAAILASVSVDLEPIAPALPDPVAFEAPVIEPVAAAPAQAEPIASEPAVAEPVAHDTLAHDAIVHELLAPDTAAYAPHVQELLPERVQDPGVDPGATVAMPEVFVHAEPAPVHDHAEPAAFELTEPPPLPAPAAEAVVEVAPTPISADFIDSLFATDAPPVAEPAEVEAHAADAAPSAFALTPFETGDLTPFEGDDAAVDMGMDVEALWAAAVPELGLDAAPLLDLDDDAPAAPTAVVLPWPSHDPKADATKAQEPQDLIEAALAGVHADLTSEPVEPLRTPDVAAATAHVVFRLAGRVMAIPLAAVSEIARPPRVTRLPHVPAWVLGIANLRGDIVSILDLEGFFSGKSGKTSHEQRMLALRPAGDEVRTAVLVDSVDGIQAFEDARVSRVTRGYDAEVAPYARGLYQLEEELAVVLDAERLLQSKPMRQFEDGAGAR